MFILITVVIENAGRGNGTVFLQAKRGSPTEGGWKTLV
jgi:hypothetical protein